MRALRDIWRGFRASHAMQHLVAPPPNVPPASAALAHTVEPPTARAAMAQRLARREVVAEDWFVDIDAASDWEARRCGRG